MKKGKKKKVHITLCPYEACVAREGLMFVEKG